jgi:hypothetical protein
VNFVVKGDTSIDRGRALRWKEAASGNGNEVWVDESEELVVVYELESK